MNEVKDYVDMTINGKIFPLWILQNFKQYRMKPIISTDENEDPCINYGNIHENDNQIIELHNYQKFIGVYLDYRSTNKSILLYHGLGSGKTATAINVYNALYNASDGWNVFILIKASLHNDPWLKDIKKFLEKNEYNSRYANIRFVHYDSPKADKDFIDVIKQSDGSKKNLYIIDEAHNFIKNVYNNIINKAGKRAQTIYDLILEDKKNNDTTRVILISATPAVNTPYELVLIFNLLRENIFPETELKFNEIFISSDGNSLNPDTKNMFQRRIIGLVSYYKGATSDLYAKRNIIQRDLRMDEFQYRIYKHYENIEKKLELANKGKKSTVYKSYTRQASNFIFPFMSGDMTGENRPRPSSFKISEKDAQSLMENKNISEIDKEKEELLNLYNETLKQYISSFDSFLDNINKNDHDNKHTLNDDIEIYKKDYKYKFGEFFKNHKNKSKLFTTMYECSAKMTAICFNTFKSKGPILVYSNYVRMEGLEIFRIYLKYFGFDEFSINSDGNDYFRYCSFTGDISQEERTKILKEFNNKENLHGKKIRIIMISPAGSEGISLKNIRQVHIMEPYWHEVRIEQLIGRAIRQCSHKDIPMQDRIVDIYRYNAVGPNGEETTDKIIQTNAYAKHLLIDSFLQVVRQVAIDCELFKDVNMTDNKYQCFQFNQNSYFDEQIGPAYKLDILQDIKLNNGLNATNSIVKQIKTYKIKAVKRLDKVFSQEIDAWYNPDTGIVYDFDLKFPIGKVLKENDIPNKIKKGTYIIDNIIVIPKFRK